MLPFPPGSTPRRTFLSMNISSVSELTLGQFGISHGSGIGGELIRHATESWAGHAFIYVGFGRIIEANPGVATISPATKYDDAIWAYKMPLASYQSERAVERAHAMVGTPYDWAAYVGFALEVLNLRNGTELDPIFKHDKWRVCSALVDDCLQYAGVSLDWQALSIQPGRDPNLVSPAMLLDLATVKGWV
jgi:uncharacterized protein YycO